MALSDLVEQELSLLSVCSAVGVDVERLFLTVLLYVVLRVCDSEDHLCGVLDDLTQLDFLYGTRMVLASLQTLVVEEEELVEVLHVGGDGELEVVKHLVVEH